MSVKFGRLSELDVVDYVTGETVLDTAEAFWKASRYSGSGDLLDLSSNGHDLQLGSSAGADSNDPTHQEGEPDFLFDLDDFMKGDGTITASPFTMAVLFGLVNGSTKFEVVSLDAVANLDGEYGIRIEDGDDYRVSAPGNWDADSFVISGWVVPDWDHDDGEAHMAFVAEKDSDNRVELRKQPANDLLGKVRIGGTDHTVSLPLTFSAADALYLELRWDGTTLTLRADTDQNGTLESSTDTPGATFGDNTGWTFYIGQTQAQTEHFEGSLNLLITDDGSASDPGDDRFNAGNGMALEDWLATVNDGGGGKPHSENLVLHVGGNSDGSAVQLDSFSGATALLSDTADGGRLFDGSDDDIDHGAFTGADGQANFSLFGEHTGGGASEVLAGQWDSATDGKKHWRVYLDASGNLVFEIATDGAGASETYTHGAGDLRSTRFLWYVRFEGGAGTNADKVQVGVATYQSATRDYGAWDTDALGDASTPATLRTPSAVDLLQGANDNGTERFSGTAFDLRLNPDTALSIAALDAQELDQAYHDEWDHWWPLESDANDQIGSLDGTITGATSVTDGRSLSGRFERYTRQGRYNFDGVDDNVNFGAYTDLDGAVEASFWGEYDRDSTNIAEMLIGRSDNSDDGKKQFAIIMNSASNTLQFRVATDGAGAEGTYLHSTVINAGDRFRWFVRFKGDEGTNADKVQMGVSVYDASTGTYGAWTTEQLGDASTPGSFRTPNSVDLIAGKTAGGTAWSADGKMDELRINAGTALSIATLEANTIYSRTDADWDHAWPFDGDANDAIGNLDGTVTGAQQVADGRKPVGLTEVTAGEIDRATGSVTEGTHRLRLKDAEWKSTPTEAVDAEDWTVLAAVGEESAGTVEARIDNGMTSPNWTGTATLRAAAYRDTAGGSRAVEFDAADAGDEFYIDDLRAYELATLSPSTATKAQSDRCLMSITTDAPQPYFGLFIGETEAIEGWARNVAGTRFGPAGGDTPLSTSELHDAFLEFDGISLKVFVNGMEEATSVSPTGSFSGLDQTVLGALFRATLSMTLDGETIKAAAAFRRLLADTEKDRLRAELRAS